MSYHNYEYTKPIEVRGGIRGRVETRRLRLQLVGQAMDPDPGGIPELEPASTGAAPTPAGDRSCLLPSSPGVSRPRCRAPASAPTP